MSRVSFAEGTKTDIGDSPRKAYRTGSQHTNAEFDLEAHRGELRFNMRRKIVVLEHPTFLTKFMSQPTSRRTFKNTFAGIATPTTESDMYDTLPDALNKSGIFTGYTFVATPRESDSADPTKQAVDCGMYRTEFAPQAGDKPYACVDWSRVELSIECKTSWVEQDPFDPDAQDDEPTAAKRQAALGQILSYAELVFRHQQRTWHFMVILLGDFARIVRFDRSTIFATTKFNYKTHTHMLGEFLWRFSRQTPVMRGHDPTAKRIERNNPLWDAMVAKKGTNLAPEDYVQKLFADSLDEAWPWWQLEVPVDAPSGKTRSYTRRKTRRFVVGKPHFMAPGVTGRGTRGYVALPLNESGRIGDTFVYLKDAWRVDHDGIEKEGDILHELNEAKVNYVPTLVCHGDLSGPEQTSDWRSLWKKYYPQASNGECPLKRHQHYRLVVAQVGKSITEFGPGSDDLVLAIFCVLQAHAAAYDLGIIHRDISAGNILLYQSEGEWYGLLNDWELSKRHNVGGGDGRQPDRTGTWQFMSVHASNNESRRIILPDELESIFHVLLYLAVRFLPHNIPDENVGQFLYDYFDDYSPHASGYRCGKAKKAAIQHGVIKVDAFNGDQDPLNTRLRFGFDPSKPAELPSLSSDTVEQGTSLPAKHSETPPDPAAKVSRSPTPVTSSTCSENVITTTQSQEDSPVDENVVPESPQGKAPSPQRSHPLNHIIDTLLRWFKAYYALDDAQQSEPEASTTSEKTQVPCQRNKFQRARQNMASRSTSSITSDAAAQAATANMEEHRALAKNLMSHQPFLSLLDHSFTKAWPQNDKGVDKKPKNGVVVRKSHVPAASATHTSSRKRQLEEKDAKKERKRSRTSLQDS